MNESKTQHPAGGWLEELIDRLNDISVSQIPSANFEVVNALDKITDELRERLAAAADGRAVPEVRRICLNL